ncbi:class I SAM-dependent methyltransferase [Quadrisphaera sp. DSM 44207]|uniref:class I SAM-dependent methyltransferase n=1 Tax=Quadrisphaera sp. DSM 44207 TaxID=1881057 RepID=UPI0015A1808E
MVLALGGRRLAPLRARACAPLAGHVLEVGFGAGPNAPHYPPAVTRVSAVEPSDVAWRLARRRVAAAPVPVERVGLDGQRLPLPDACVDAALSTWTLCSIPDPVAAAAEVRRVLRPGGTWRFVEHGLAPDASVRRWQHRLDPFQARLAGGCRLTVPVAEVLAAAGLRLEELRTGYLPGAPRPLAFLYEGSTGA